MLTTGMTCLGHRNQKVVTGSMGKLFDTAAVETAFTNAAIDPTLWGDAMDIAASATNSVGAVLIDTNNQLPGMPTSQSMGEVVETYIADGWYERDVRFGIKKRLTRIGVACDLDLFTREQIEHHPYYQEFLAPHRLRWFAGVRVASGDSFWCLSIQRSIKQGPFSQGQLNELAQLADRLGTASAVSNMLGFSRIGASLEAFEFARTAALIFDGSGNVIQMNDTARRLLDDSIKVSSRRLFCLDKAATAAFEGQLRNVLRSNEPSCLSTPVGLPRLGRLPVLAYIMRLGSVTFNALAPGQAVAVLIDPETKRAPARSALRMCFDLTNAEARLAQQIAMGAPLDRIHREFGISYETARNQLKAILAKTETHSQSQLVSILTGLGTDPA